MAVADTTVKYFNSSMSGFSTINNTAGSMIAQLDAALQSGAGTITPLTSLVISNNVATATYNGGHGFTMVGNFGGPVITIAGSTVTGADANALNRQWRIASVPSTTQFTFVTSGIADQTATGTISATRSPAGWTKVYSDTNKAAYRADSLTGNRHYLYIDETYTTYARIRLYETMSDINTGTGPTPTDTQMSGGAYIYKASSTNRQWTLFADGQAIYFFIDAGGNSSWQGGFFFGDILKFASVDAASGCLVATNGTASIFSLYLISDSFAWMPRSYTQLGGSVQVKRVSSSALSGLNYPTYTTMSPNPADGKVHLAEVDVVESSTYVARGRMPGLYSSLQTGILHGTVINGSGIIANRTLLAQIISSYGVTIDMTGPWR